MRAWTTNSYSSISSNSAIADGSCAATYHVQRTRNVQHVGALSGLYSNDAVTATARQTFATYG